MTLTEQEMTAHAARPSKTIVLNGAKQIQPSKIWTDADSSSWVSNIFPSCCRVGSLLQAQSERKWGGKLETHVGAASPVTPAGCQAASPSPTRTSTPRPGRSSSRQSRRELKSNPSGRKYNTETLEAVFRKARLESFSGVRACPVKKRKKGQQCGRSPCIKEVERVFQRAISNGDKTHKPAMSGFHMKTVHRRSGRAKTMQATFLSAIVHRRLQRPA